MALNTFASQFNLQSIPSYNDWVASNTFDPFSPKPFAPTSYTNPGIQFHPRTRGEFRPEGGTNVDSRFDYGYGFSGVYMAHNFRQERSRFKFSQKRVECSTDVNMSQVPPAQACQFPAGQSKIPVPTKTTPATIPRVAGPRPFPSPHAFHARKEPLLAVPRAVHPLPTWLTHFEDHEEEILAEFCPPSASSFTRMIRTELHPAPVLQCSPLNTAPLLGFADSNLGYKLFESYADSNHISFESELSAPASYYGVDAGDWPTPYQGHVASGEEYAHASAAIPLGFHPRGSYSLRPSGPRAPSFDLFDRGAAQSPDFIPWSAFTNPFTGAPITETPPPRTYTASVSSYNTADDGVIEDRADRFLMEVEEGLGFTSRSGLGSESSPGPEGWYDWFDLTGYTSPVPPQRSWVFHLAAGFEAPPSVHTTVIPSPDVEVGEDVELDAVAISPRSPAPWWR